MNEAGLSFGAPAAGAGLNDPAPMTMRDRAALIYSYRKQGLSQAEAMRMAGVEAPIDPPPASQSAPGDVDGMSRTGLLVPGALSYLSNMVSGAGTILERQFGIEGADEAGQTVGDAIGPSVMQEAARDERYAERARRAEAEEISGTEHFIGDALDMTVESAPAFAAGVGGAKGGQLVGRAANAALSPAARAIGQNKVLNAGGRVLLKAVPGGSKLKGMKPLLEKGFAALGAFAVPTAAYMESGRDRAIEEGLDVSDPEVQDRIATRAVVGGVLESVPLLSLFGKLTNRAAQVEGKLAAAFKSGGRTGLLEGSQEVVDLALEEYLLNEELRSRLGEDDWAEMMPFLIDRFGRDAALAMVAGGGVGVAAGAPAGFMQQKITNQKAAQEVRMAAQVLEPMGMGTQELEELTKTPEGAKKLQDAVQKLSRVERTRSTQMREIDRRAEEGAEEEVAMLREQVNTQLDARVDAIARVLGAPKSLEDVRRERNAMERERRTAAMDRIAQRGLKPQKDLTPEVAEQVANRLDRAEGEVDRLQSRVEATTNPERKAETQRELDTAIAERQQARIDARMKVEGMTPAQALRAVQGEDKQTEAQRRRQMQSAARERAIERQTEIEMPETMAPALRVQRAQEIIAEAEADVRPDAGLDGKIKRLERQRRAATSPEDVDRLTDEIADLEARRGLPTPAVEAARRVLQAQGVAVPPSGEASGPTAQPAEAEGLQPEGEASGPVGAAAPAGPRNALDTPTLSAREAKAIREASTPEAQLAAFDAALSGRRVVDPVKREEARTIFQVEGFLSGDLVTVAEAALAKVVATDREAGRAVMGNPRPKRVPATDGFDVEGGNPYRDLTSSLETGKGLEALEMSMLEWSAESGFEVGAHMNEATGEVLGVGTNDMINAIMPPAKGLNDRAITFTHTHTQNTPFSSADIRASLISGQRFRAVLPDGSVIAMRPLRRYNPEGFFRIFRAVREHLATTLPADMPFIERAVIRQEAFLQAMEMAGAIEYQTSFRGLSDKQKDYVNATVDAITDTTTTAFVRDGAAGRTGTEEAGGPGGSVGERRAVDAAGGEIEEGDVDGDDWDPEGFDLEQDVLGYMDPRSSNRRKRPVYNEERVGEIADKIIADVTAQTAKPNTTVKMIRDGTISRDQLIAGIGEYLRSDGRKQMYTVTDVRRAMFRDPITFDMIYQHPEGRTNRATKVGTKIWSLKPEYLPEFQLALGLERLINKAGFGEIRRVENRFAAAGGWGEGKTYFLEVSPELRRFTELVGPEGMQFDPPLKDTNDTSKLKRREKSNMLSPEGLEAAARTARYLQANRYKIDRTKLYAIQPDDLISGKSLARDGLKKSDIPQWDAMRPQVQAMMDALPEGRKLKGLPDSLPGFDLRGMKLKDYVKNVGWKITEKRKDAEGRIRQLRAAYDAFVAKHGPDGDVGFLYQIDDRGRIYADGSFHPQADGDIKAIFVADGKNIVDDMVTVDNSASGWQINALMAYDHVAAPHLNMGRGQATEPGYSKSDLYNNTLEAMRQRLLRDAEGAIPDGLSVVARRKAEQRKRWARYFVDTIFPSANPKSWALDRSGIKPAIIAMNYGGLDKNFRRVLQKVLKNTVKLPGTDNDGAWSYLTEAGMEGVEKTAPHALALQKWTLAAVKDLSKALYARYGDAAPTIELTIGLDGKIAVRRQKRVETETRVKQTAGNAETEVTVKFKVNKPEPDHDKIAKAVWANLVQSYDAAVLHRAVERYKRATDGAYITTNHDSFTVPREHEGAISSAVRESMRTIMEQVEVPKTIYEELTAMARREGVELDIQEFNNIGRYNYDDLMTSTPVFGEDVQVVDAEGKPYDFVPEYAELPEAGAELRRAVDEEVPAGGAGAPPVGSPPARAPVREQGASLVEDLPPEVRRAVDVADYMASLPQSSSLLQKVQNVAASPKIANRTLMQIMEDTFFNAAAPIRRLEIAVKGALPQGAESAFKAVEMAVQDSGRQEALLYYGAAKFGQYGEYAVAPGTMGLKDIFKLAGGDGTDRGQRLQDWMQWMVARRAQDLAQRGIKTPLTPQDIQTALAKGANIPEFQQAADAWKKFNDANLDFLEQSGRINAAQKAAMQADDFYVPFYRSDERVDGTSPELELPEYRAGAVKTGVLSRDPGIMKIKGGDKLRIDNLMQNMIRNSQAIVAAGMRNKAANQTFDLMQIAGMARVEPLTAKKPDPNAVRIWQNGVESWLVPEGREAYPVMMALAGMQPVQQGPAMQFMSDLASIFRQGITLTPPFMIRNAIRGAVSSGIMTTGANLTLTNNTITGFRDAFNNGQATQAFKAQSGMGDYRFGNTDAGFGKNDILIEFGLSPKTMGSRFRSFMEKMEHVGSATELADRIAARETMIKNGMRPDEASYQALTIMNYSRKGNSQALRAWLPLVPFLNARLQGLSRMAEGAVGRRGALGRRQAVTQMAMNGLIYSALGAAIWIWNASDEERREKYANEPLFRRLNYHIIYAGDKTLYIPKAFELGHLFTSIPELFADAMVGDMNEGGSEGLGMVGAGVLKMVYDTVAMNLIPAAVLPSIEAMTNYSFFRQAQLVGQREQDMLPADRTSGASMLSRLVGRDMGISDLTGISPTMIEHWLSSHGGIYYTMLSTAVEIAAGDMGLAPVRPGGAFGDVPLISPALNAAFGSMVKDSAVTPTKFIEEFYRTKDYITQIYRSATSAARGGDVEYANRLMSQFGGTAAAYRAMNKASTRLTDINTALRMLRDNREMSREQKRIEEEKLIAERNGITRDVMKYVRSIEDQQGTDFRAGQGVLARILP